MKIFNLAGLIIALAALLNTLTYLLIFYWYPVIEILEPNLFIRNIEILACLFGGFIVIKLILRERRRR